MAAGFTLLPVTCYTDLISLLHGIINGLIQLAIPVTVIMIIWAAVLYITSRGGAQIQTATKAVIWAAVGFGVLLISSGIISVVQDFFGVTSIQTSGGTTGCGGTPITAQGPTSLEGVLEILRNMSGWIFTFAIIAGVAMIIVAGISYIFARGDTTKASRAANVLVYAVVGIAIASLAWAIINIVANFLTGNPIFATVIQQAQAASAPISATRPSNAPTGGPQKISEVYQLFQNVIGWIFVFTLIAGVAMIIFAGLMYIISRGNATATQTAGRTVIYAVVGIALAALAWAIVNLVGNFLVGTRLLAGGSTSGTSFVCQGGGVKSGNTYGDQAMCTSDCTGGSCTTAQAGDYVCQGPTIHAGNVYGDQTLCQGQCEAGGGICAAI